MIWPFIRSNSCCFVMLNPLHNAFRCSGRKRIARSGPRFQRYFSISQCGTQAVSYTMVVQRELCGIIMEADY